MNRTPTLRPVFVTFTLASALAANATLIDFENLTGGTLSPNGAVMQYNVPLVTNGYTFSTTSQFGAWTPGSVTGTSFSNYTGSTALFSNSSPGPTPMTIAQVGGGGFGLLSLDVANGFRQPRLPASTVTFTGNLLGGGTVTQTYAIPSDNALHTVTFSNFTGLSSVVMSSTGLVANEFQFDNVNVQAVPEPASVAALGLGALTILRRRRRVTR